MHSFPELIYRATCFTLETLNEANDKTIESLQTSRATHLVKTLQMIRLQKTIMAVGMFSLYEAKLQDSLNSKNGFVEVKKILKDGKHDAILEEFIDIELAINVLKHGRGRSYDELIKKGGGTLKAHIKQFDEKFFDEGDVSEISTLINVDDNFINHIMEVINKVSEILKTGNSEFID